MNSSNLRRYTAKMTQSFDIPSIQMDWVCEHLRRSLNVHRQYYRTLSDVLERVQIAKILLIQDLSLVSKFHGKNLENIQSILHHIPQDVGSTNFRSPLLPILRSSVFQVEGAVGDDVVFPLFRGLPRLFFPVTVSSRMHFGSLLFSILTMWPNQESWIL